MVVWVENLFGERAPVEELRQNFLDDVKGFEPQRLVHEYNHVFGTNWKLADDE